ncbi:Hypp5752 [Branchiostoma lanceolatum]|uniref:Hypp5752 protein n=1 Tax=Branchiostoma lanceolatum TaxID=7740 RepID=A0A8J9VYQ7_BRALA|nr:Hypp5752 [Branchiostoma lanceolatum]
MALSGQDCGNISLHGIEETRTSRNNPRTVTGQQEMTTRDKKQSQSANSATTGHSRREDEEAKTRHGEGQLAHLSRGPEDNNDPSTSDGDSSMMQIATWTPDSSV